MSNLLEMATSIVSAHVSNSPMSKEELLAEIKEVYQALSAMEKGVVPASEQSVVAEEAVAPVISKRKAFGKDQIICMICGKGFKTLARHLGTVHDMTPKEYRAQFDIPRTQSLAAKSYSESRRQMAIEKDLGAGLAKARAARAEKKPAAKKPAAKKAGAKKAAAVPSATEA